MILEQELKAGLLYASTPVYKHRLQFTINTLQTFLSLVKNPYLALSFGKQSIVLAHIIYNLQPYLPMFFLRSWESYFLHDYEKVIGEFKSWCPINLNIVYKDNVSWNNWPWKKTRDYGQKDLQNMADENYPQWDGVIMGLGIDESFARRLTCTKKTTNMQAIFRYVNGKYRCTPIQFWGIRELAAYIAVNKIPLLSAYNSGLQNRTTARITKNCAEMNGLIDLKKRYITNYNIIIKRFPELSAKG